MKFDPTNFGGPATEGSGGSTAGCKDDGCQTLSIMTWNVNCLVPTVQNMKLRHGGLRGFLDHFGVDIACFQEVKLPDARITKELACVEGFQSFWSTSKAKPGYSGVTTWCRTSTATPRDAAVDCLGGDERPDLDAEGRCALTDHGSFVLLNVYVPNAGDRPERARLPYKLAFLRALRAKMDELTAMGRQVIAVGDFNVAAESRDVHPTLGFETMYDSRELDELRNLAVAYPDVWRRLHSDGEGSYTVWEERTSARAFNLGLRIDYVFVSPGLLPYVSSCEILSAAAVPPKWSDHAAVLIRLRVTTRGSETAPTALPPAAEPLALPPEPPVPSQIPEDRTQALGPFSTTATEQPTAVPPGAPGPAVDTGAETTSTAPASANAAAAPPPCLQMPPPPSAPCSLWQSLESRFVDRNQRSIRELFGKRPAGSVGPVSAASSKPATAAPVPAPASAAAAVGPGPAPAAGGSGRLAAVSATPAAAAAAAAVPEATYTASVKVAAGIGTVAAGVSGSAANGRKRAAPDGREDEGGVRPPPPALRPKLSGQTESQSPPQATGGMGKEEAGCASVGHQAGDDAGPQGQGRTSVAAASFGAEHPLGERPGESPAELQPSQPPVVEAEEGRTPLEQEEEQGGCQSQGQGPEPREMIQGAVEVKGVGAGAAGGQASREGETSVAGAGERGGERGRAGGAKATGKKRGGRGGRTQQAAAPAGALATGAGVGKQRSIQAFLAKK